MRNRTFVPALTMGTRLRGNRALIGSIIIRELGFDWVEDIWWFICQASFRSSQVLKHAPFCELSMQPQKGSQAPATVLSLDACLP